MAKTIIVAGKDTPAVTKFSDGLVLAGRNVILTGKEIDIIEQTETTVDKDVGVSKIEHSLNVTTVAWSKASSVSSRTVILEAESIFDKLDEVVLYFDEHAYAQKADLTDAQECAHGADEMILSYQYMALETLKRYEKRNSPENPGTLVFVLRVSPSAADAVRNPSVRDGSSSIASPVVASAAASFEAFAENIAAIYGDYGYVNIYLVRSDGIGEVASRDEMLSKWMCDYIDANPGPLNSKKSVTWIKAGAKLGGGGFSLFGRK